ncbi:MAG: lysylphosphatidylglycerol synthase domain-containing protein, partial [Planctomycetota bacterium]
MIDRIKKYWPFIKIFIWILVACSVGFQFWRILHLEALKDPEGKHNSLTLLLQQLQNVSLSGVFLCGLLYIVGIGFSGWFWADLLNDIKQPISIPFGLRCFYIAQLGKYVPGKGLALFLRIHSAMKENVSISAGVVTSIYEVLFTMATGATLAVALGLLSPDTSTTQITAAAFLMLVTGIPIMPGLFPFIVKRLGRRFLPAEQLLVLPGTFRSFFRGLLS